MGSPIHVFCEESADDRPLPADKIRRPDVVRERKLTYEVSVSLWGSGVDIVIKPGRLHLLRKGEEVWRCREIPFVGCPERAGRSDAGLDLVYRDQYHQGQQRRDRTYRR